ncbi:MAG: hypothetical protein HUJ25_07715 [Crocinitomicaceae bacterium]|nr:hypothetical protein [Crocinitomicaceae bacterium]
MSNRRKSPYRDKDGFFLYEGDVCRSWREDILEESDQGYWLYEKVKLYKNDWYLFEIGFDYEKFEDEPYPLSDHYFEVEVIDKDKAAAIIKNLNLV